MFYAYVVILLAGRKWFHKVPSERECLDLNIKLFLKTKKDLGRKWLQIPTRSDSFPLRLGDIDGKHINTQPVEALSATTSAGSLFRLRLLMQHTNSGTSVWSGAQGSASQMLESLHSQTLRALYKDLKFPSAKPLLVSNY